MTNSIDSRQNQVLSHSDSKALEESQFEKPVVDTHQSRCRGSCPLPLPEYHITRTESEIQLCENMAIAEMRDRLMFTRLVNGIRQRQDQQQHFDSLGHRFPHKGHVESGHVTDRTPHPPLTFMPRMTTLSKDVSERTIENIISTYKETTTTETSQNIVEDSATCVMEDSQYDYDYSIHSPFTVTPLDSDRDLEEYGQHANIDHDDHHVFDMDL